MCQRVPEHIQLLFSKCFLVYCGFSALKDLLFTLTQDGSFIISQRMIIQDFLKLVLLCKEVKLFVYIIRIQLQNAEHTVFDPISSDRYLRLDNEKQQHYASFKSVPIGCLRHTHTHTQTHTLPHTCHGLIVCEGDRQNASLPSFSHAPTRSYKQNESVSSCSCVHAHVGSEAGRSALQTSQRGEKVGEWCACGARRLGQ